METTRILKKRYEKLYQEKILVGLLLYAVNTEMEMILTHFNNELSLTQLWKKTQNSTWEKTSLPLKNQTQEMRLINRNGVSLLDESLYIANRYGNALK